MTYLADHIWSINLVVRLYLKSMGSYSELPERDTKSMHRMTESVLGSDNEPVSYLQEVLNVEGHLWAQPSRRIDPCNLDELLLDILLDDFI